jgi:hypothetical protein
VIGSSATVLANLAYLIGAVVFAVIIGGLVWLRHRQPKSVDANMALFRRGLSALAPDRDGSPVRQPEPIRPAPTVPVHVRVDRGKRPGPEDMGADAEGGQPG